MEDFMKKKYILIFLLAFAGCFAWSTWHDAPKQSHSAVSSQIHQPASSMPSDLYVLPAELQQQSYPYLHFRTALKERINKNSTTYVSLSIIPKAMQHAVIATEDRRFYDHGPIDIIGIGRAAFVNFQSGETIEGGSTISQQVIKNTFLTQDRTMTRKIQEFALSVLLEKDYSKDEILEIYLNTAYFGANAYGIDAACQTYFGIKPEHLTIGQSAMLAGLLQAPTYYNPLENYKAAKERQKTVLTLMAEQGVITNSDAAAAYKENLHLK
jgi:monofunctional glycosyltransferase